MHCELDRSGRRHVVEVLAPSGRTEGGVIEASTIFATREGRLVAAGGYPARTAKYTSAGFDPATVLRSP